MKKDVCILSMLAASLMLLSLPAYAALTCDYNGDWDVDGWDLAEFAGYIAISDLAADLNNDDVVDVLDLAICSAEFGTVEADEIVPSVSVTNLRDNSVVKTGLIFGTADDNDQVAVVEIRLDSGDFTAATGTTHWSYQFPIGAGAWRDDSRHTISVRAQDRFGNHSDVITLAVRKGPNKDVNGDGYVDLAVGASGEQTFGRVYIFHGGMSGVSDTADTTIIGEVQNNSFGDALALGDVNGDGYADLAIGNYGYDSSHGRVWIFNGSASGIADTDLSAGDAADTTLDGEAGTSTNFGSYLGIGDSNGDGYADLAVGAPGWYGKIHIFHGGPSGIPDTDLAAGQLSDTTIVAQSGGDFGEAVKFGDIDGDSYADLVIGARGYNSRQGRAYIFYGSHSGIADTNLRAGDAADTTLTGISGNFGFGYRTAFADVNADGFTDLAVVAANNWEQGYVYIFHGNAAGIADTDLSAGGNADTIITGIGARNNFGYALTLGDANADGCDDLAVGARLYNLNQGRLYIFYGTGSGIPDTDLNDESADVTLTGESGSSLFGHTAVLDDFNGDRHLDLAVGAYAYSYRRGRAYVFHNTGAGISDADLSAGDAADTIVTGQYLSEFGFAMAD